MTHRALLLSLVLLAHGCTPDSPSAGDDTAQGDGAADDGGAADGGADGDGGAADGGASGDGGEDTESPRLLTGDAWCYPHTTGEPDHVWQITAQGDDPQGAVSLEPWFDGVTVVQAGSVVVTWTMTCDDDGACFASFTDTQAGTRCTSAGSYTVRVQVLDEDGNWSEALELAPRQCPDATPC